MLSDPLGIVLIAVMVGFMTLIAASPGAVSGTVPIMAVPAGLLVAGSLSVIGIISVDREAPWPYRELLLKDTIALVTTSVSTIAFVFLFELLPVPDCELLWRDDSRLCCDRRDYSYTAVFMLVGGLMVSMATATVLQLVRLSLEVFFYARTTRRGRQLRDPGARPTEGTAP